MWVICLVGAYFAYWAVVGILNELLGFSDFELFRIALHALGLGAAVFVYNLLAKLKKTNGKILPINQEKTHVDNYEVGTIRTNGFNAKYSHDNISLDVDAGQLWVRDKTGKQKVFQKTQILRWEHNNTHDMRLNEFYKNYITLHVEDLDQPIWHIQFNRHWPDTIKWQGRKNTAEAKEWYSRLTTWVNN